MADYRRKKKSGKRYGSGAKAADYRRRPYTARLGGLGGVGSYGAPRNYYRSHDFRYEREPETKSPKTETHYTLERPTETYRLPPYRTELGQPEVEKIVGQTIEGYRRGDIEREKLEAGNQTQRRYQFETPISLQDKGVEAKPTEETALAASHEIALDGNLDTPPQPEPLAEVAQETSSIIDKGQEVYESYELPIADLELLLIELVANRLEAQPDKIVEPEAAVEQQ